MNGVAILCSDARKFCFTTNDVETIKFGSGMTFQSVNPNSPKIPSVIVIDHCLLAPQGKKTMYLTAKTALGESGLTVAGAPSDRA